MDKLTVVYDGGMVLLGRLERDILYNPRIVIVTNGDPEDPDPLKRKTRVNLSAFPFILPFVLLKNYTLSYPFSEDIEKGVYELYLTTLKQKPILELVK
jgi:hypothetical protein